MSVCSVADTRPVQWVLRIRKPQPLASCHLHSRERDRYQTKVFTNKYLLHFIKCKMPLISGGTVSCQSSFIARHLPGSERTKWQKRMCVATSVVCAMRDTKRCLESISLRWLQLGCEGQLPQGSDLEFEFYRAQSYQASGKGGKDNARR